MRAACISLLVVMSTARSGAAFHPLAPPEHTQQRAGCPQSVAPWAVPGQTSHYAVGYVGGACLGRKGEPRNSDEGVFGWDYAGRSWNPGRVFLNWCHFGKQPQPGPYKSDGPHVPDVFSIKPIQRAMDKHKSE